MPIPFIDHDIDDVSPKPGGDDDRCLLRRA
jgi:hypothetical protein